MGRRRLENPSRDSSETWTDVMLTFTQTENPGVEVCLDHTMTTHDVGPVKYLITLLKRKKELR